MTSTATFAAAGARLEEALSLEPRIKAPVLIGVWTFVVMGVVTPSVLVATTNTPVDQWWLGVLLITTIAAGRFSWIVGVGDRRLFEMTFWIFTYVFMGLAPMAQIRQHTWADTVSRTDWTLVGPTVLLVLAGVVAYLAGVGFAAHRTQRTREAADAPGMITDDLSYRRVVALACVSIAYNTFYLMSVGFNQFGMTRMEAYERHVAVFGEGPGGILIRSSVGMTILVSVVALMRVRKILSAADGDQNRGRVRTSTILLIVALALLIDTLNPISNARYLSGTAILAVLAASGLFATRNRFRLIALLFVAALVLVFPLADAFRYSASGEFKSSNPLESLLSADYDSFAQVNNAILVGTRDGIHYGHQFAGVLLWWFPRTLWPGKPFDTGIMIANERGYAFTNLSAPLWAEAYLNAGFVGAVLIFFVIGWWLYRWDTKLDREIRAIGMPSVLGCILPFYMLILLRGSMLQAMSYLTIILLCYFATRRRSARDVDRRWGKLNHLMPPAMRPPVGEEIGVRS